MNFLKSKKQSASSDSTDDEVSPYREFVDNNGRLIKPQKHEIEKLRKFEEFKQKIWKKYLDTSKETKGNKIKYSPDSVAKEMKIHVSVVKNVATQMKNLKTSTDTSTQEIKNETQNAVYEAVCELLKNKKYKDKEDKVLEKVAKDLSITSFKARDFYCSALNEMAINDPRSFFYRHFDASVESIEDNKVPELALTVQNKVVLSYYEVADNFAFRCKSNEHKQTKMNFSTNPCLLNKAQLLTYIIRHVTSVHKVNLKDIIENLTYDQVNKQYEVDKEVRRRFDFLTWAFDSSPRTLAHIVAVVRCSSAIASASSSLPTAIDDSLISPLFPEFLNISNDDAWIYCFFKPGSVTGTFKCRLPHVKQFNISTLFCDGGFKMHLELRSHLNLKHNIKGNYGKLHREFTESNVTIQFNTVPDETREYMKKLLEPTLPDLATTSTTISSQNLQKMKMLTDGLPSNIYAALCCFKPVDSNLECLLPHFNHNSSKCLTFDYKQDENDINLLCQEIERHLSMSHHFFISSFATKEWIGNGTNYISFKQMSLEMQEYYFKLKQHCLQPAQPKKQSVPELLTLELAAQLKPALPENASSQVEMAVIMSVPHAFFEMYDSENQLQKCFRIMAAVDEHLRRIVFKSSNQTAEVYHIFAKPPSTSKFDYIDRILYGGFTTSLFRLKSHVDFANAAFRNRKPLKNEKLYQHIADCWNNSIEVCCSSLKGDMTETQGYFSEYAVISFLSSLAQNHNHSHGSTTPFKDFLDEYDVSQKQIVKIGAALIIDYHQKQKRKFHLLQPIPFDRSNLKPNRDAHLTLTTILEDITIPNFRLNDTTVNNNQHCSYALHLFVALFTIRARLARYYLTDQTFLSRLQSEDEDSYNEAYDLIESVLTQVQLTVDECVEWAYKIWKRVFVTNVLVANAQPNSEKLYPATEKAKELNVNFITSSALLLAEVIDARGFTSEDNVRELTEKVLRRHSKSPKGLLPQFFKVTKFSDLKNIDKSSKQRHLLNLPKFDAGTIEPIEPYQDMEQTRSFLIAAAQLRAFNHKNVVVGKSVFEPKHDFKYPVFYGSLNFVKLV